MHFGRVPNADNIPFDLPKLDARPLLHRAHDPTIIRIGAPTWSNLAWKGVVYPEELPRHAYLKSYSLQYATIEMNSSFYAIPTPATVQKWVAQTSADFQFCPKIPQSISHHLGSREMKPLMLEFLSVIEKLDGRLGPLIFQLPPHFEWSHLPQLKSALELIPSSIKAAVEFRHSSWFFHNMLVPPVFHYLQTRNVGTVITDVLGHRNLVHSSLTAPFVVIRWMGFNGHPSDSARLAQWSNRLTELSAAGARKLFFFIHQSEEALIPWSLAEFGKTLKLHGQPITRFWEPTDDTSFKNKKSIQLSLDGSF